MEAISSATGTFNPPQTKQCPFCDETIQARAIKCRFCSEFLNTNKAKALEAGSTPNSATANEEEKNENILFSGRPSLWTMAAAAIKGLIFLALAGFLMVYPLEELSIFQKTENPTLPAYDAPTEPVPESEIAENPAEVEETSRFTLTDQQVLLFRKYRIVAGLGLAILVMLILLIKMVKLKMTRYEVSAWSRGILDRRVDNLDMFRVLDLKLRRSLLDCIVGVGTVSLITTDKTDPQFTFEKIRKSRKLYDIIKKASLEADRRNSVIHLE